MGSNQALETEVANQLAKLDKLVGDLQADRDRWSAADKDFMHQLRQRVNAGHRTLLVAKLISEPARESLFLKLHDSLNDVEELMASLSSSTRNFPYPACSSGELADGAHFRPNGRP